MNFNYSFCSEGLFFPFNEFNIFGGGGEKGFICLKYTSERQFVVAGFFVVVVAVVVLFLFLVLGFFLCVWSSTLCTKPDSVCRLQIRRDGLTTYIAVGIEQLCHRFEGAQNQDASLVVHGTRLLDASSVTGQLRCTDRSLQRFS